ncbi:N-acetyltransferase 8-like [Pterocles gutturalis]
MVSYCIRQYRDQDYDAVRTLFASGICEHAPACYWHVVRAGRTRLGLLVLLLAARAATGSWLLGLGAVVLALATLWRLAHVLCNDYVQRALSTDLRDVRSSYLRAPDADFWVAEAGGAVVGMVAVTEPQDPSERGAALELMRMSVRKDHRGRGISQALCGEVLRFARARGYGAVVLSTSMVQVPAQRLYVRQGFRKVRAVTPSLLAAILCFQMFHYRCDLPSGTAAPTR